jgi:cysteine desulfurase
VPPDRTGVVDPERFARAVTPVTGLACLMHVNNELGTIQTVAEAFRAVKARAPRCVTLVDAVQSFTRLSLPLREGSVDLVALSAHKIGGPRGVGALLCLGRPVEPLYGGGGQEAGRRPGTENVPGIVGLGRAAAIAREELPAWNARLVPLRERLRAGLAERIDFMNFTGHAARRLPGHVSFWIEYVEGESLLLWLSMSGVCAASGSACSSNIRGEDEEDLASSHVLTAIGVPPEICHGSICFSLGKESTAEEVDYVLGIMPGIVQRLWAMSPLYAERARRP